MSPLGRMSHLLSGTTIPGLPPLSHRILIDRVPPLILGFIVAFSPRFAPGNEAHPHAGIGVESVEVDQQVDFEVIVEVLRRWGGPLLREGEEGAQAMAKLGGEVRELVEQSSEGKVLIGQLDEVGVSLEVSRFGSDRAWRLAELTTFGTGPSAAVRADRLARPPQWLPPDRPVDHPPRPPHRTRIRPARNTRGRRASRQRPNGGRSVARAPRCGGLVVRGGGRPGGEGRGQGRGEGNFEAVLGPCSLGCG